MFFNTLGFGFLYSIPRHEHCGKAPGVRARRAGQSAKD
jgi:hypothetical protein